MAGKKKVGRPVKFESVEEVESIIDDYMTREDGSGAWVIIGDSAEFRPTMSGLARVLGLSRQGLLNYSNKDEFFDTIKRARDLVHEALERRLYGNNVTGIIFNLKNNFGWKDKIEQDHTSSDGSMTPPKQYTYTIIDPKHKTDGSE